MLSSSEANLLYAKTAGIAANKPIAVATKASEIPGATALIVACVASDKPLKCGHNPPNSTK